MTTTIKIDRFEVMYPVHQLPPRIVMFGSGRSLGQLMFMPDGSGLPPDTMNNDSFFLYFHLEKLESMLALMRSGETLYVHWIGPGCDNRIQTASAKQPRLRPSDIRRRVEPPEFGLPTH